MKIIEIEPNSPAERAGLNAGDVIISAQGGSIRDALDVQFYIEQEASVSLQILRGDVELTVNLRNPRLLPTGIVVEELKVRRCGNNCVFCFIDQQPSGLRESLYVKDEDVRYSFIYGNYVTLSNTPEWEIERIIEQRMSPIYVSVHTTDETMRRKLLGNSNIKPIMPALRRLTSAGIVIHTQVVVVPGYNSDYMQIERTVEELYSLGENCYSCALVPVGLTRYREGLPRVEPVSPKLAEELIAQSERFRGSIDRPDFLQLADELFLLAGAPIPQNEYYGDYPQEENGVGMVRLFLDDAHEVLSKGNDFNCPKNIKIDIVTGVSAKKIFDKFLPKNLGIDGCEVRIIGVENEFWGHTVNVANLLTGKDIISAISSSDADLIFLPPNILNDNDLFLDSLKFSEFQQVVRGEVFTGISYLSEMQQVILNS